MSSYPSPAYAAQIWTLPNGDLALAFPGTAQAPGHQIVVRRDAIGLTAICSALDARQATPVERSFIGTPAAPTNDLTRHQAKHRKLKSPRCPFCLEEAAKAARLKTGHVDFTAEEVGL